MGCDYDYEVIDDVYNYLSDLVNDDDFISYVRDGYNPNDKHQHKLKCCIASYVKENIYKGEIDNGSYTNSKTDALENLCGRLDDIKDAIAYYGDDKLSLEDVIENPERVDLYVRQSKVSSKVLALLENNEEIQDYYKDTCNEERDFLKEIINRIKDYQKVNNKKINKDKVEEKGVER